MKKYEIWVGRYHLGQGYHESTEPFLLYTIEAVNFKTACIKMELRFKLAAIEQEEKDGTLNSQSYPWWFNENTISNAWLGKYYETKEDALKSFK